LASTAPPVFTGATWEYRVAPQFFASVCDTLQNGGWARKLMTTNEVSGLSGEDFELSVDPVVAGSSPVALAKSA
jgi:hypothetical protein